MRETYPMRYIVKSRATVTGEEGEEKGNRQGVLDAANLRRFRARFIPASRDSLIYPLSR